MTGGELGMTEGEGLLGLPGTAVYRSHVEDYYRAPRWRLTTRYPEYIVGDESNEAS